MSRRRLVGAAGLLALGGCGVLGDEERASGRTSEQPPSEGLAEGPGYDPLPELPGRATDGLIGATPDDGAVRSISTADGHIWGGEGGRVGTVQLADGSSRIRHAEWTVQEERIAFTVVSSDASFGRGEVSLSLRVHSVDDLDRDVDPTESASFVNYFFDVSRGSIERSEHGPISYLRARGDEIPNPAIRLAELLSSEVSATDDRLSLSFSRAPFVEEFGKFVAWYAVVQFAQKVLFIERGKKSAFIPASTPDSIRTYANHSGTPSMLLLTLDTP